MLRIIARFFLSLLEALQDARQHQAEKFLAQSVSHYDLERREKILKQQGLL